EDALSVCQQVWPQWQSFDHAARVMRGPLSQPRAMRRALASRRPRPSPMMGPMIRPPWRLAHLPMKWPHLSRGQT
ncbi:MAG: hypothetical protein COB65_06980, partial [Thalassobium sp.]